jgi:hypothetical protein
MKPKDPFMLLIVQCNLILNEFFCRHSLANGWHCDGALPIVVRLIDAATTFIRPCSKCDWR